MAAALPAMAAPAPAGVADLPASAGVADLPASAGVADLPASTSVADPKLIDDLVTGNHILYDHGVVDGFSHISARHDKDPNRYLLSRSMAPALVTKDDIIEHDLDSNPVDAAGRPSYLERFIHGEIH